MCSSCLNTGRSDINLNLLENTQTSTDLRRLELIKGVKRVVKGSLIQKREFHHNRIKAGKRIGPRNLDVLSVITGSLLGNSGIRRSVEGTRFCYRQSSKNIDYLFWLYYFLVTKGYCSNLEPRKYTIKVKQNGAVLWTKKIQSEYKFNTFIFRSFNWLHKMFYPKGKKVINLSIENYITPLSLAIWISSPSSAYGKLQIKTDLCRKEDIDKLIAILKNRFGFICYSFQCNKSYFGVGIAEESKDNFITIIKPYLQYLKVNRTEKKKVIDII